MDELHAQQTAVDLLVEIEEVHFEHQRLAPATGVRVVAKGGIQSEVRCALQGGTQARRDEERRLLSASRQPITYVPPRLGPPIAGAANLGLNPTFRDDAHAGSGREPLMLEVHLLDFDEDLYGRSLRVEFVHRLRDERRFPNVEALREQIGRDVASARRLLGG